MLWVEAPASPAEKEREREMLTKIEYRDNANWKLFWTSYPEEFRAGDGYSHGEGVSGEELLEDVARAEEAFCGDGSSCSSPDDICEFAKWLCGLGYSVRVSFEAAAKLAAFYES
jgi:hypothetical protein